MTTNIMRQQGISLGRVFNIPIRLDLSWFLVFVLATWSLATSYYPEQFSAWSPVLYWVVGAATTIMLFVSVVLHELGHSVVATMYGIPVRRITLFIFGGVSETTSEPTSAGVEFWIAVAGPLVSIALAGFFYLSRFTFSSVEPLLGLVQYLAIINLSLAIFNLIPGFPLDGGRVLRAVIWGISGDLHKATLAAANVGRIIGFGFIGLGALLVFGGNFSNGLWIAFIGWFLESAAGRYIQMQRIRQALAGHRVSQAMSQQYAFTQADTTLKELADHQILGAGRRSFVVKRNGIPLGLLTVHQLKEVDRDQWGQTTAVDAMTPFSELKCVEPDTGLWEALQKMGRDGVNQLPVLSNGHVEGMLRRDDVIGFLRTVEELGA